MFALLKKSNASGYWQLYQKPRLCLRYWKKVTQVVIDNFIKNQDFVRFPQKGEANNATLIEYALTLDMAKELSLSSREIATLCDKRHSDVKRDIEVLTGQLDVDVSKFAHIYTDSMNRQQSAYSYWP